MKLKLLFLFFFIGLTINAQQANDCSDAIVVCGNTTISSNVSGFGTQELDNTANPCLYEELNSLWLSVNIATSGNLAFTIRPDNTDLEVDYDFYVFGPTGGCGNLDDPIRCSSTNPTQAGLNSNHTGLNTSEVDQNEGPGENGNSFVSAIPVVAGEQYYILIDRPIGNGGFSLDWTGTAGFLPSPEVFEPVDVLLCATSKGEFIDLTEQEAAITNSTTAIIRYYLSYEDAFDYRNEIADPTQFSFQGDFTPIFIRVTNPNGCFEVVTFALTPVEFDPTPELSYTLCDSDRNGREPFDIPTILNDITNSMPNNSDYTITLHPNESDATSNLRRIASATFETASNDISARVSLNNDPNCFITFSVSLIMLPSPYPQIVNLVQCDVDETNSLDGIAPINLEQAFPAESGVAISYYQTIADRDSDNSISNPQHYTNNTPFNETIYYRITSSVCESVGEIALIVNPTLISTNTVSPITQCDDDFTDDQLQSTFNIDEIRQNYYEGLEVAFYSNLSDVALEQNSIEDTIRTGPTTIYVRLENENQCQGVEEIELNVQPLPDFIFNDRYQVCTDGQPLILNAPSGYDTYQWFKVNGSAIEEIGNTMQISIHEDGNYQLEVGTNYQNNGITTTCTSSKEFIVSPSNRAIINQIIVGEISDENAIEVIVSGDGVYEYSLDEVNYQDEPQFDRLNAGFYTVYVRDKNGCGVSTEEVAIIGFPKFFTPNGDGKNDTWQIIGVSATAAQSTIYIYDRYGKMVKQITSNELGWDGSMNGQVLPSSDYWFRTTFENGVEFKGHFALKR